MSSKDCNTIKHLNKRFYTYSRKHIKRIQTRERDTIGTILKNPNLVACLDHFLWNWCRLHSKVVYLYEQFCTEYRKDFNFSPYPKARTIMLSRINIVDFQQLPWKTSDGKTVMLMGKSQMSYWKWVITSGLLAEFLKYVDENGENTIASFIL